MRGDRLLPSYHYFYQMVLLQEPLLFTSDAQTVAQAGTIVNNDSRCPAGSFLTSAETPPVALGNLMALVIEDDDAPAGEGDAKFVSEP